MPGIKSNIVLSICIPTRGRSEILNNTLKSIFDSNANSNQFEVVVYDSSDDNDFSNMFLNNYPYSNFIYKKGPNDEFLNLINALKLGNGKFLKLHNDYTMLYKKAIDDMITVIEHSLVKTPLLYFSNGSLKSTMIKVCPTLDCFLKTTSYNNTWLTSFGIWRSEFIQFNSINIHPLFPHLSLLFALPDKQEYIIYNKRIFDNQPMNKKGGYNLFETFAVTYLKMLDDCVKNNRITRKTFDHVRLDLLKQFLPTWYANTKIYKNNYTYDLTAIKKHMAVYYTTFDYYTMIFLAYKEVFKKHIKTLFKAT